MAVFLAVILFSLSASGWSGAVGAPPAGHAVRGQPLAASLLVPAPAGAPRLQTSSGPTYDEQLGTSFTQNFRSLEYNVTAVAQTDPVSGDGPAYLLNGLTGAGYWYQVGLAWNWYPGNTPGTGFDMVYEVFDSSGASILPAGGGGGLQAFTGAVEAGDTVVLRLYFELGQVVMYAQDANTGAVASASFSAQGATEFTGQSSYLPFSPTDANGFFTGLMTEWYHPSPYYSDEAKVTYEAPSPISSAWMWMDEFQCSDSNCTTRTSLFYSSTSGPITYSSSDRLVPFSSNGATEFSDPYAFVTGSLSLQKYALAVVYSVQEAGIHPSPVLSYYSNGIIVDVSLPGSGGTFLVDQGSRWNITALLPGSGGTERWITLGVTSGVASSNSTVSLTYFHQYRVTFGTEEVGGGSGFSQPAVSYVEFGAREIAATGAGVWADAGTNGTFPSVVQGGTGERWVAAAPQVAVSAPGQLTAVYSHQYFVTAAPAPGVGGVASPTGWYAAGDEVSVAAAASPGWMFEGWSGSGAGSYSGNSSTGTVTLGGPVNETAAFYPAFTITVSGEGSVAYAYGGVSGTVASGSRTLYLPPGTPVELTATPSSFYSAFQKWQGALNGSQRSGSVTVAGPSQVGARFATDLLSLAASVAAVGAAALGIAYGLRKRKHAAAAPAAPGRSEAEVRSGGSWWARPDSDRGF